MFQLMGSLNTTSLYIFGVLTIKRCKNVPTNFITFKHLSAYNYKQIVMKCDTMQID